MKKRGLYFTVLLITLSFAGVLFACGNKTKDSNSFIPPVPEITYNNGILTINPVGGCEYKIDSGEWQDNNIFTVQSFRRYSVFSRYKETETHFASDFRMINFFTAEFEGKGTPESPYLIYNAQDLRNISYVMDAEYMLMNDIDLNEEEWAPIGLIDGSLTFFTGKFYGNGNTVSNYKLTNTGEYRGLFGWAGLKAVFSGLNIKGVTMSDGGIKSNYFAGALLGFGQSIAINNIKLEDVFFEIQGNGVKAGGLIGEINGTGNINNITAENTIITVDSKEETCSQTYIGGIAGRINGALNYQIYIDNVSSICDTGLFGAKTSDTGDEYELYSIGGIAGYITNAFVSNTESVAGIYGVNNKGTAVVNELWFGGIAGQVRYCTVNNINADLTVVADTVLFRGGGVAGNCTGLLTVNGADVKIDIDIIGVNVAAVQVNDFMQLAAGGIIGRGNIDITNTEVSGKITAERKETDNICQLLVGGVAGYSASANIKRLNIEINIDAKIAGNRGYAGGIIGLTNTADIEGVIIQGKINVSMLSFYCGGILGGAEDDGGIKARFVISAAEITGGRIGGLVGEGCYEYSEKHAFDIDIDDESGVYYDYELSPLNEISYQSGENIKYIPAAQQDTLTLQSKDTHIYDGFPSYFVFSGDGYPVILNK